MTECKCLEAAAKEAAEWDHDVELAERIRALPCECAKEVEAERATTARAFDGYLKQCERAKRAESRLKELEGMLLRLNAATAEDCSSLECEHKSCALWERTRELLATSEAKPEPQPKVAVKLSRPAPVPGEPMCPRCGLTIEQCRGPDVEPEPEGPPQLMHFDEYEPDVMGAGIAHAQPKGAAHGQPEASDGSGSGQVHQVPEAVRPDDGEGPTASGGASEAGGRPNGCLGESPREGADRQVAAQPKANEPDGCGEPGCEAEECAEVLAQERELRLREEIRYLRKAWGDEVRKHDAARAELEEVKADADAGWKEVARQGDRVREAQAATKEAARLMSEACHESGRLRGENEALKLEAASLREALVRAAADLRHGLGHAASAGIIPDVVARLERLTTPGAINPPTTEKEGEAAPCGGSRCFRSSTDGAWIHSSKSYGTCSERES